MACVYVYQWEYGISMLKLYTFDIKTCQIKFCEISNFHIFREMGISLTSQTIILFKINKFLLVVAKIWMQISTWTEIWDKVLDYPIVKGRVMNKDFQVYIGGTKAGFNVNTSIFDIYMGTMFSMTYWNPLNLASKHVGKFAPEIFWDPLSLANCSKKTFSNF